MEDENGEMVLVGDENGCLVDRVDVAELIADNQILLNRVDDALADDNQEMDMRKSI